MTAIERLEAAWAAERLTEDSDRIMGIDRKEAKEACFVHALLAAQELDPHPLDSFIAAERDRTNKLYRPHPGQWWTNETDVSAARVARAVVTGLLWVRRGVRPTVAANDVEHFTRGLPPQDRDAVTMRMYHLIRLAGLGVV